MAGKKNQIIEQLINYAITHPDCAYPAFVVKNQVVISRGYNQTRELFDETLHGDVVAIRAAQDALETGDLSGYELYSLFEPTILSFDVALWAGIKDFYWCIDSLKVPEHYNNVKYNPLVYAQDHPDKIRITHGIRQDEVIALVKNQKIYVRFTESSLD